MMRLTAGAAEVAMSTASIAWRRILGNAHYSLAAAHTLGCPKNSS